MRFIITIAIGIAIGLWLNTVNIETMKREAQLICRAEAAIDDVFSCDKKCKVEKAFKARQEYISYLYTAGEWSND